ncbi:glycosyltransferase [Acidobacteria bacterium AH-259-O06]|nr:glycosyltransferase [Acidobacteria bacterium AH-259-O06]
MKISICIPTYNRAAPLRNCLQSIILNRARSRADFEVCVSDNCSTDETGQVVRRAQADIAIKYHKNPRNLGIPRNFINAVEMADGEFVWLIGDDDLLLPCALERLSELINQYPDVDYFYVNSFHLTTQYVFTFPQPFDTSNLPENMEPFSSWPYSGEMKFMDLIDPRISFDFLGGMYLSVFRRPNWIENAHVIDKSALADGRVLSSFDNTFPHVKIFAKAFANSRAFFCATPLSVCLSGAREWAPMYPFVKSVRLVEALDEYRKNGLPYIKYLKCKNYALNTFLPDLAYMIINRENSGFAYIKPTRLMSNLLYPNFYFSVIYYLIRKLKAIFAS